MECEVIYLVIARKKKTVLCEYAQYSGNFEQISVKIITQLNSITEKTFYSIIQYDNNEFYALVDNEYIFLALVDKQCPLTINHNDKSTEDSWLDCSYYLYEFLYSIKEGLYKNYTASELKQSQAYTLVGFVDVLSTSIAQYQSNKTQFKDFTKSIIGIPTCELGYKKRNNESRLSIIKNTNEYVESEEEGNNKELMINERRDTALLNSVSLKSDMLSEEDNRKRNIWQMVLIIGLVIAFILCVIGLVLIFA